MPKNVVPRKPVFQGLLDKREGEESSKTEVDSKCRDECESAFGFRGRFLVSKRCKIPSWCSTSSRRGEMEIWCRCHPLSCSRGQSAGSPYPPALSNIGEWEPMAVVNHTAKRTG